MCFAYIICLIVLRINIHNIDEVISIIISYKIVVKKLKKKSSCLKWTYGLLQDLYTKFEFNGTVLTEFTFRPVYINDKYF